MNCEIQVSTKSKTLSRATPPIVYALTTRDRADHASVCLSSLDEAHLVAFPGTTAPVYVLDDSESPDASHQLQSHINSIIFRALQPRILTAQIYYEFRKNLLATFPSALELLSSLCRAPGTPGWNLSCARNFLYLFLIAQYTSQQIVCFIDDDIICTPVNYCGQSFLPTVSRVFKRAVYLARKSCYLAVGPKFLGCEDIQIARSLIKAFRRLYAGVLEPGFPHFTALSSGDLDLADSVPSGGLMLTTVETLKLVPLMPFYNEDWIWGRLVSLAPNSYVARIRGFAIHAPPRRAELRAEDIVFQETGEALYAAIAQLTRQSRAPLSSPAQILNLLTQKEIGYQLLRRVRVLRRYRTELNNLTSGKGDIPTNLFPLRQSREGSLELIEIAANVLQKKNPGDLLESVRILIPLMVLWKEMSAYVAR
jgi:hypothetical protein